MTYLDYAATTPVDEEVLSTLINATKKYIGNPNANHQLGIMNKNTIEESTTNIINNLCLSSNDYEVVYTSGSSEANNLAIKGVCFPFINQKRHIITTPYEHSSVIAPCSFFEKYGFIIDLIELNEDGSLNINHFKKLLENNPILVTINAVNSEFGLKNSIQEIGSILKNYPEIIYHVDMTQLIGKENIDFSLIDMFSFSAHKIYGIKGIGALIKKKSIKLIPIIHGGKSTSIYRSGTPALELILSLDKALELAQKNIESYQKVIIDIHDYCLEKLKTNNKITVNSKSSFLPNIINFSIKGIPALKIQQYLSKHDIFVSTQTACSLNNNYSLGIFKLTNDMELAKSSIRISLSYLTTTKEIDALITALEELINDEINKN